MTALATCLQNGLRYNQLGVDQQRKIVEKHYDINVDYFNWSSYVCDDAKQFLMLLGFSSSVEILWESFRIQGSGVCFTGTWFDKLQRFEDFKKEYSGDTELLAACEEIESMVIALKLLGREPPKFVLSHNGHYYHEQSVQVESEWPDCGIHANDAETAACNALMTDFNERFEAVFRDLMVYIYRQLEGEYEYLTSDEAVIETIEANEYLFDEDGNIV